MKLFEDEWGIDTSPVDETEITTTMLYFSKQELNTFKRLELKKSLVRSFNKKETYLTFY